jgi:benzoate membrane transport protein
MRAAADSSFAAFAAGFVATLVGFTSTIALIFHAAQSLGATPEQAASWVWALGIGMGVGTIGLSLWARIPILITWSTPGAAVIAAAAGGAGGITMPEAVGAFLVCGLLMLLSGVTGWFEKLMNRIPATLAAALLAGILTKFALMAFAGTTEHPLLVIVMFGLYLLGRRLWPRFAVLGVLAGGVAVAVGQGLLNTSALQGGLTTPVLVMPAWSWQAALGMGVPLFIVTMASQAVPGVAAIRVAGYKPPVSPLMSWSGVITLLLAPFGGYTFNLAAITAAIVTSPHAHAEPGKRYTAALWSGLFYIAMGLLGSAVAGVLAAFPPTLVIGVAGLALLGTIGGGLATALGGIAHREAALITFLVTLSGMTLWGVGSAFWGLVAGAIALFVEHYRAPSPDSADSP